MDPNGVRNHVLRPLVTAAAPSHANLLLGADPEPDSLDVDAVAYPMPMLEVPDTPPSLQRTRGSFSFDDVSPIVMRDLVLAQEEEEEEDAGGETLGRVLVDIGVERVTGFVQGLSTRRLVAVGATAGFLASFLMRPPRRRRGDFGTVMVGGGSVVSVVAAVLVSVLLWVKYHKNGRAGMKVGVMMAALWVAKMKRRGR